MSMINELVKELREYGSQRKGEIASLTLRAADTIEMLSEKAREQEWILCSERLPGESDYYLVTILDDGGRTTPQCIWFAHEDDYDSESEWREIDDFETVIAWMPLPEPWEGADEEEERVDG